MSRHLDPDRSRPPTFWPFPIDIDTSVCDRCSAMVPATDKAHDQHRNHHHQIDQLTAAPVVFPPAAGAINRSRPGGPREVSTGRLPLPELGNPARFAR